MALRDSALSAEQLAAKVETVGRTGAADGIEFDEQGNLYLSTLEDNAIHRLTTQGRLESVADDPRIAWPDSFAIAPDGSIYFTTSQIHRGSQTGEPYRLLKLSPPLKESGR